MILVTVSPTTNEKKLYHNFMDKRKKTGNQELVWMA